MNRAVQSCFLSLISSAMGLCLVLLVGRLWWSAGSGLPGTGIGLVFAGGFAAHLRRWHQLPVSIVASTVGAIVATFFAIASAEVLPPGSSEWVLKGGAYGAMFGLPVAIVLGLLGPIESRIIRLDSKQTDAASTSPSKTN